jgi:hypothetical protein
MMRIGVTCSYTLLIVTRYSCNQLSSSSIGSSSSNPNARLTEVKHPDHTLITYPNLGDEFYPSSQWFTENGPIPEYVLEDIFS